MTDAEKKALAANFGINPESGLRYANALLDTIAPKVVQYQARLREPILPECADWVNISEEGARTLRNKHSDVYDIRELVYRSTVPKGRAATLAIHLREQAKIFRKEDALARGANELEEAAFILEFVGKSA